MANRPAPPLPVGDAQRASLTAWARSCVLSKRQVRRARIILLAAEGVSHAAIATQLGCSEPTVRLWRQRFTEAGIAGLEEDAPGRGRPATYDERLVAKVITATLGKPPTRETHWSSRAVAARVGVSKSTVLRTWQDQDLHPPQPAGTSSAPAQRMGTVTDVLGLYLDPPEGAVVLRLEEKSEIQGLDRTKVLMSMRPGQLAQPTRASVPHNTATLFAALDVASREITGRTHAQHRHQEFLSFLQLIATSYPRGRIHLVLDSHYTYKHPDVRAWLNKRRRIRVQLMPTSASWMNQTETWFYIAHRQAMLRGVFRGAPRLGDAIERFLAAWNANTQPFAWVKSADQS
jgi:transposase